MRIVVIGDEETVFGLALVGCAGRAVRSAAEADEAVDEALGDASVGLVCVTRDWASQIRDRIDRLRTQRVRPIVMEIPDRQGRKPEQPLRAVIERAVGVRIRGD